MTKIEIVPSYAPLIEMWLRDAANSLEGIRGRRPNTDHFLREYKDIELAKFCIQKNVIDSAKLTDEMVEGCVFYYRGLQGAGKGLAAEHCTIVDIEIIDGKWYLTGAFLHHHWSNPTKYANLYGFVKVSLKAADIVLNYNAKETLDILCEHFNKHVDKEPVSRAYVVREYVRRLLNIPEDNHTAQSAYDQLMVALKIMPDES